MTLPTLPVPYSENFQQSLMAAFEVWRQSIEAKAEIGHTHGAGGLVLSIVANAGALGVGTTYGESRVVADTGRRHVWVSPGVWVEYDKTEVLPGTTIIWRTETPPPGYLECNGAAISRTAYAALFAAIGTRYGVGNGTTTFNIPYDLGEFFRVWAHGSTNDPDRASRTDRGDGTVGDNIGTKQADQLKSHYHPITVYVGYDTVTPTLIDAGRTNNSTGTQNSGSTGGNQTNPRNGNIMACIKY